MHTELQRFSKARWACRVAVSTLLLQAALTPTALGDLRAGLNESVKAARSVSSAMSVHVVEVASGEEIYSYNADQLRIIASNTKLLTTAAAFDTLGPAFFFETNVLSRGELSEGGLRGDVAVLGGGDPNISGRHYGGDPLVVFRHWAQEFKRLGVHRIEGDLFLVTGLFEPPLVHPDWPRNQLHRWYEAPVAALSFSDNCVLVRVSHGRAVGEPARVELIPDLGVLRVENTARTVDSSKRHMVVVDRRDGSDLLSVSGSMYRHAPPVESWVTVPDPVSYFGVALKAAFEEEGVELLGGLRPTMRLPSGQWRWVTGHRSDLMTTTEVINKRSQNFFAESLLKAMGARLCGSGSWQAGLQVVEEFLERVGIQPGDYRLADGSGMSRGNQFTTRQLTTVLRYMFDHEKGQEFLLTLPYSGEEGLRWERRLADEPYRGNIFAKTGSLTGVSTLSGYAKGRSGKTYAFSILCNRTTGNWGAARAQDRILRVLVDEG
ncbi:MAG: D-alanyl-D-alanine carboxypeptidase/D-alanyl-D-alanine-endopeptidase [Nitrospirae bacterium]|nr:D-alanyl-D-alanine carboxypeptidase/D-alanyl-D-alanine-endopeptidase [Nitrospirota bacterium]